MHGLLDFLFVAGRKDERDSSDDDINEAQNRSGDETEGDNGRDDLYDGAVFDEVADHVKRGKEKSLSLFRLKYL